MMLITGLDNIREAQTIPYPSSGEINKTQDHSKGYVHGFYNHMRGAWEFGWHETREDAVAFYDEFKTLCSMAPDILNWFNYSEMVIWSANGSDPRCHQTRWALLGVVVEE